MAYTTILSETRSDYGGPYVYYIVEAQTANRTSSTIDVDIRISARLGASDSTLKTGNELFGNISVEGQSHEVTIHGYYDKWEGTTWHTVTTSFTVIGLSNSTTALSATFGVTSKWLHDYQDQGSLSTRTCSNISISSYTPPTPPEPPEPEPPEPPEPPTPSVNTISVQPIPDFIAGYDGDSFMLTCNPSGGAGYTYKWYQGATIIGTSQNLTGTLSHSTYDNTSVYCVVTDSTGGTATTNRCSFRVGTTESQTQVSTKQIEPVRVYNGSSFIYVVPFTYNGTTTEYCSWNITYTGNNRANIAIAGNAIVG